MLKRVRIQNYKSLVDLDIKLEPLTVIFGPNAAGKSNFLDVLQLLSRLTTCRTLREAFDPPYRGTPLESFTFGPEGITGLLARESASFTIEADVELSDMVIDSVNQQIREMKRSGMADAPVQNGLSFVRERNLRYRIEVEILPKTGILRVADEYVTALNANGEPTGKRKAFLDKGEEDNRLHLRMEGQAHPTYYERFLDHSILTLPLYPPHYPHLVALGREFASWSLFYFEPRERMRATNPVKEVRHIGLMGEELGSFLNTLQALDPAQFKAVERSLRLLLPSVTGIEVGPNSMGEVELKLLEGKTPIPARVLSEGTLRMLGLLAMSGAKEPPTLIGFEEPENGIHPRRIKLIAELLKTRAATGEGQMIVTTHSLLLADLIPQEYLYVCRKLQRQTCIEPFARWGLLRKSKIEDALDDDGELPISQQILRGDFDA